MKYLFPYDSQDLGYLVKDYAEDNEFQNNIIRYAMSLINSQLLLKRFALFY